MIFGNLNPKIKRCCILQAFTLFNLDKQYRRMRVNREVLIHDYADNEKENTNDVKISARRTGNLTTRIILLLITIFHCLN